VTDALVKERSIVRGWLMRGTLHLVDADDFGWLLALFGPIFSTGNQARQARLGLTPDIKKRGMAAIRRILTNDGPLTRHQIVDRLRVHGIALDPRTQAPIHLIQTAALAGVLCLGPDTPSGEPTYVLIRDWLGTHGTLSIDAAVAELAWRYFSAFGPATLDDFVAWSGLPASRARAGLTGAVAKLDEISLHGRSAFLQKGRLRGWPTRSPSAAAVRLLPAFDTYLLGYASRDLYVAPVLQRRLQRGGGWIHPCVLVDGRAVAAWSLQRTGRQGRIDVEPYERLNAHTRSAIASEARDIGRFLDVDLTARIGEPAVAPAPRSTLRKKPAPSCRLRSSPCGSRT
jgi:hypothetical protein